MTDKQNLSCNFCGKSRDQVDKLVAGPSVFICNECIKLSYTIIEKDSVSQLTETEFSLPTPAQIKKDLNQHIVGHDDVKDMLSVCAYNHYKRIQLGHDASKSNILIVGPTGTGKTLFAQTLSKKLNVPLAIVDSTSLTEAGYVGDDVDTILERLLITAEYDLEHAQRGIIYIDEIDKKARRSDGATNTRDVSGEGVQQALLRLIEGTTCKIKINSEKKMNGEFIDFCTDNVLFIVGGAFVGIEQVIERRLNRKSRIGFGATVISEADKETLLKNLMHEDVVEYGLIPEFVGRLPIIGVLDNLSRDQMLRILTTIDDNVISHAKKLLLMDGLELEFESDFLDACADLAVKKKLGARALVSIIDSCMINIMFRAPDLQESGVTKITFNKYPMNKDIKPTLTYQDGSTSLDTDYTIYRGLYEEKT